MILLWPHQHFDQITAILNTLWMCAYPDGKPGSRVRALVYPDLGSQTESRPLPHPSARLHSRSYYPSEIRFIPAFDVWGTFLVTAGSCCLFSLDTKRLVPLDYSHPKGSSYHWAKNRRNVISPMLVWKCSTCE